MRQLQFIFSTILLLVANIGFSQQVSIERYTQEDGLPSDLVKALAMDSSGFIWVGTDNGIAKIEGGNIIKPTEFNPIDGMYKDFLYSHQGLVAASDMGIFKISQDYKSLYVNYLSDEVSLLPQYRYPKQIFGSKDSSLWIAFQKHLVRIKDNRIYEYNFPEKNNTYHFFRGIQVFEAGNNQLYALSQKGYLYLLNADTDIFTEIPWAFSGTEIFTVFKLNDEQFLVGCDKGMLQMNFKNGEISDVENLNFRHPVSVIVQTSETEFIVGTWAQGAYELIFTDAGLQYSLLSGTENLDIQDILLDNQKQVWVASEKGIFVYRQLTFHQPFKELHNRNIRNFSHSGTLFFCDDNLVYRLDTNKQLHHYYTSEHGVVTALLAHEQGLYMGTTQGQIIHKKNDGSYTTLDVSKHGDDVYSLALDKNKNLWFLQRCPNGAALLRIDSIGNILDLTPVFYNEGDHNLNMLKTSPHGELYIAAGGRDEYLYSYNYETNIIENLSKPIEALRGELLWNFDLFFSENDTLLLASHKGLYTYHNQVFERLELGFYADKLTTAVTAENNRIWISFHDGLLYYDYKTTILYNDVDGLPSKFINPGGLFIDEHNNLWAGTTGGLAVTKIPEQMPQSTIPVISGVKKSGAVINPVENTKFLQNSLLQFTFASPDYPAKHIQYQYALVKNDEPIQWIDLEKKADFLYFDSLKKGNYTLKVRARNKGHFVWSDPTTYQFRIFKVWYTRLEYIIGIYLIFLILGYLYIKYSRATSVRKRVELETVIAERTKELIEKNEKLVKTQNQLIQSEKMASVGILAAGVAHEINNPINYVNGGIAVLKKTIQKLETHLNNFSLASATYDSKTKETYNLPDENEITNLTKVTESMFGTIEEGIKKTTDIVQSIRIFSSSSENVFMQADINDLIDSVLLMLYNKHKGRIEISCEYDTDAKIMAIPANIQQVFMNLIVNAIQAIPQKGIIWIKTKRKQSTIIITVKDTGKGISNVIKKKIFDPFFTTKDVGTGTGLGLYLSYTFVQQHHGTITVNSEPGQGAEFIVELPLTQQPHG